MIRSDAMRWHSNAFLRNVSTLAAGTVVSQIVLLAATPLLTRLYSAADFGVLALFTSVATIVAIFATGRYEHAIGLADSDEEAWELVIFICGLGGAFALVLGLLVLGLNSNVATTSFLNGIPRWLLPVYTFLAAVLSAFQYWSQRRKDYGLISLAGVVQILVVTSLNLAFGWLGFTAKGLIWGLILGQLVLIAMLMLPLRADWPKRPGAEARFPTQARRYVSFPKFLIISDLSSAAATQLPTLALSHLFTATIVGYFSLANRMLRIPSIALTTSIAHVFRNEAIDAIRASGSCRTIYLSTLKKLLILSLPVYLLLGIASPLLFSIVFGADWAPAGYCAQLICIMAASDFVVMPLNMLYSILNRQKLYMILQLTSFVLGLLAMGVGYAIWGNPYYCVFLLALSTTLCNGVSLIITGRLAAGEYRSLYAAPDLSSSVR